MADVFSAESRLIHAGTERVPGRPATPPLAPASIYVSQGIPRPGRGYGRDGNPGWEALEQALGGLEDAEAVAFASGQAATMNVFQTLGPGAHVVAPRDAYFGTGALLRAVFAPWGLGVTFVDMTDLDEVARALRSAAPTGRTLLGSRRRRTRASAFRISPPSSLSRGKWGRWWPSTTRGPRRSPRARSRSGRTS